MRLIVDVSQPQERAEFAQFLGELQSLTGVAVEFQIGPQGVTFDISITQLLSVVKYLRSGKSNDSPPQESRPLRLQLKLLKRDDGSAMAAVYSLDKMEVLVDVESPSWNLGRSFYQETFTVDTSPRRTSSGSMSSGTG